MRPASETPSGMVDPDVPDAELMALVAQADARAFAWLMQRHLKRMVALAQRMLGQAQEADEVAQEAFLRLWKTAPSWDPDGTATLRTWLSRVVINLCTDRLRRRRSVPLEDAGEIVDPSDSAFDTMSHADRKESVRKMLAQLPERQRTVVLLSYYEDLSGAEIARVMQTSLRAVESLLVRARRALKAQFEEQGIARNEDL